jgi:hypothetical protein
MKVTLNSVTKEKILNIVFSISGSLLIKNKDLIKKGEYHIILTKEKCVIFSYFFSFFFHYREITISDNFCIIDYINLIFRF